jgi:uncharacterized membrane-anchored protein
VKKLLLAGLILMIAAQIALPARMMISRFDTLHNGEEFRFKVAPVDPYDAFRGRYVAIALDQTVLARAGREAGGQGMYALLNTDVQGFAYVQRRSAARPLGGAYIKGQYQYGSFVLPLERYYMEEKAAPEAEKAYGENSGRNAYITVRVKNGDAVISGLYLDGVRIEDYLKGRDAL